MSKIILNYDGKEAEILRRRTANLAKPVAIGNTLTDSQEEFLIFAIQGLNYALLKNFVLELHREVSPTPIPSTPEFIRGIVNVRGDIVSVTDLSLFLGNSPISKRPSYPMFRISYEKLMFGILVDEIHEIRYLGPQEIHPFENTDNQIINQYLLGITNDMINVLDAEVLFSDARIIMA